MHEAPEHPWRGARVALLTQHGKEQVLAPPLLASLGARADVVSGFDTDTLGTFTRDVPRPGTQREAARRKAELACELSGLSLGLGSEGSFGPGPYGFGVWDLELLVLVDRTRGLAITGYALEPGFAHHETVRTRAELDTFARGARFPAHALVVRPDHADHPRVWKGLGTAEALEAAFEEAQAASATGRVFVEHDLRAHLHPTRMGVIGRAMEDLMARVLTLCPACEAPGYGIEAPVPGLPCGACGEPTQVPRADAWACVACSHREERPRHVGPRFADPGRCDGCNP
jgi:hypothetical protein